MSETKSTGGGGMTTAAGIKKRGTPRVLRDQLVEMTAQMLAKGFRKFQIKAALREHAGYRMPGRTCEDYLSRARKALVAELDQPKENHSAEAVEFYKSEMRDLNNPPLARLTARTRLDQLLGLDAPRAVDVTSQGKPLTFVKLTVDPAEITGEEPPPPAPPALPAGTGKKA